MKVFLISHIADVDGIMPIILSDLVFNDYDYKLLEVNEVDSFMDEAININLFDEYDKVIMVDLCINEIVADRINSCNLKNKFVVLDHHFSNLGMNKYSFIKVIDGIKGIKMSGTSLYYDYLTNNYNNKYLKQNSVMYMVNLVQLADTWQWVQFNVPEARDLSILFFYYGVDKFIEKYQVFLRENKEFYFEESEKLLLELDKIKKSDYFKLVEKNITFKKINGYNCGIVFAEQYRSELGNFLAQKYIDKIDLVIIINLNRSISYRCVKENIDVSEFASLFNGKGHKKAAGSPLPFNIQNYIIEGIFHETR